MPIGSTGSARLLRAGGALLFVMGLGGLGFGLYVGLHGAEAPPPASGEALEGTLAEGELVRSPVGDPFLYGEIRIADQPGPTAPHHGGDYGDPNVVVITADGERVPVRLGASEAWRTDPSRRERIEGVRSLRGLPLIGDIETEGRLNPPFFITLRVVRPGDEVLLQVEDGVATRTYVGSRALHERLHADRESMRWPMVALLLVLGVVSLVGGVRLLRSRPSDPAAPDAPAPSHA